MKKEEIKGLLEEKYDVEEIVVSQTDGKKKDFKILTVRSKTDPSELMYVQLRPIYKQSKSDGLYVTNYIDNYRIDLNIAEFRDAPYFTIAYPGTVNTDTVNTDTADSDTVKTFEDIIKRIVTDVATDVATDGDGNVDIVKASDDYILAIEPEINPANAGTTFNLNCDGFIKKIKAGYETGIYSKYIRGNANGKNTNFRMILIRIKEGGNKVWKYLEAYFAASDSRVYHDVKYTIAQFSAPQNVNINPKDNSDWPHNLLVFGAPGTGKSYDIDKKIKELCWERNMKRVTFYEDYSYEKFIGAYLPYMGKKESELNGVIKRNTGDDSVNINYTQDKSIEYRFVPGVFLQMIVDAWFDSGLDSKNKINYVLVIEEINRANAASVFGDFFQLLDRDKNGRSEYSIALSDDMRDWIREYVIKKAEDRYDSEELKELKGWLNAWLDDFRLPENLYIWATMNSADQGVYPMDAAFKRRWSYIYKTTQSTSGWKIIVKWKTDKGTDNYEMPWDVLKTAINGLMEKSGNIEEDRFVGPRYFKETEIAQITEFTLADSSERGSLPDPLTNKLFQYLRQDVFRNNPDAIFRDGYWTMSRIREGMVNGAGINEILKIEDDYIIDDKPIANILVKVDGEGKPVSPPKPNDKKPSGDGENGNGSGDGGQVRTEMPDSGEE